MDNTWIDQLKGKVEYIVDSESDPIGYKLAKDKIRGIWAHPIPAAWQNGDYFIIFDGRHWTLYKKKFLPQLEILFPTEANV